MLKMKDVPYSPPHIDISGREKRAASADGMSDEERILVLAPVGRDAELVCRLLGEAQLYCVPCKEMHALCERIRHGAGAALLTEEALTDRNVGALSEALEAQPAWSNLPMILLVDDHRRRHAPERVSATEMFASRSSAVVLQRPVRIPPLITVARSQLEARRRQYETRDLLARLKDLNQTLEHRVARRTATIERKAREARSLALALTRAEQDERQQISGILHDHLQQLLVGLKMQAGLLGFDPPPDQQRQTLGQMEKLIGEAIAASRNLTVELSPPMLKEAGLLAALRWLAEHMEETHGLPVAAHIQQTQEEPGEEVRILLFQTVRELLLNVVKHAGATEARLSVAREDGRLRIHVDDNGAGFVTERVEKEANSGTGFGLPNVRKRLELLGGQMSIDSAPGRGTKITLIAPIK